MQKPYNNRNAVDYIHRIATEIEGVQPTKQAMIADLKMMNLKIRPLSGDLFSIPSNKDISFIQSLWKVGKIEAIVQTAIKELGEEEVEVLFDYLEKLEQELEKNQASKKTKIVKLEIFRDREIDEMLLN